MGLDWLVQSKVVNGRTVEPAETAGRKDLDPKDPEAIALAEARYKWIRASLTDPGPCPVEPPGPGGLKSILDILKGAAWRRRKIYDAEVRNWQGLKAHYDCYSRPLEEVMPLFATGDPPVIVREAAADRQDALARYVGLLGSCYDFRGAALDYDRNAVTGHAAYVMKADFPDELYLDREPAEVLELADDLSRALDHYLEHGDDKDEDSIDMVQAAISWLCFWGRAGHGFVADY